MKNNRAKFTLQDFNQLDKSPNIDFLINSMEVHYSLESMRCIKAKALELLNLNAGDTLIELGCGLGHDAEQMAQMVGNTGTVIAVDSSQRMLAEAKKRSVATNITYYYLDANNLPFNDNSFLACRADRLLVSQQNINKILQEANRILTPSGKLSITDLDFGTIVLAPYVEKINDLIVKYWQTLVLNPFVGRQLPALFKQHGLTHIKIQPEVFIVNDFETLKKIVQFEIILEDMVALKQITNDEKSYTLKVFTAADQKNEFLWSINLLTVVGEKKSDPETSSAVTTNTSVIPRLDRGMTK